MKIQQRKSIFLMTLFFGLVLLIVACSGDGASQASDDPDVIAEGLYQRSCIGCHGANLQGASGPPVLNTGLTKQEFIDATYLGIGSMPGGLVSEEVAELITDWIFKVEEKQ